MMRHKLLAVVLMACADAFAADMPKDLQPLPEPPPPPAANAEDESVPEPQVTIKKQGDETVEEYRVNGQMYMVKITPANGVPYYLVDPKGDGVFIRRNSLDSHVRPPMWVIHRF